MVQGFKRFLNLLNLLNPFDCVVVVHGNTFTEKVTARLASRPARNPLDTPASHSLLGSHIAVMVCFAAFRSEEREMQSEVKA
jgi:hypothetical protein